MTDIREVDAQLGISVMRGRTDTCSKCGHSIAEDHVPLILWSNDGNTMWVYCEACDAGIFALLTLRPVG